MGPIARSNKIYFFWSLSASRSEVGIEKLLQMGPEIGDRIQLLCAVFYIIYFEGSTLDLFHLQSCASEGQEFVHN